MKQVRNEWKTPFGIVKTPNLFVSKVNDVLVWNQLGLDIDSNYTVPNANSFTIDINPANNHKHIFISLVNVPSYNGFQKLLDLQQNKVTSTIASILLDNPTSKFSFITDVLAKHAHDYASKVLHADKATSSQINHGFRMPGLNSDKTYVRIKEATKPTSIFRIASVFIDKKIMREVLDKLLLEATKYGLPHYKHEIPTQSLKHTKSNIDFISLLRYVFNNFYKVGYRQKLCLVATGILYRYVTKNLNVIEAILESLIPADDEEYSKRFDPIKYVAKVPYPAGLRSLMKLLKEINPTIKPIQIINKFRLDQTKTSIVKETLYPYATRDQRKRFSDFETIQYLTLVLLALNYTSIVQNTDVTVSYKFKQIRAYMRNLARSENQQHIFQVKKLKELLKKLEDRNIIYNLDIKGQSFTCTLNAKLCKILLQVATYDVTRNQIILFNFYKFLNRSINEDRLKEIGKARSTTESQKKLNGRWLQLIWTYIQFEMLEETEDTIKALRDTFVALDKLITYNEPYKYWTKVSQLIECLVTPTSYYTPSESYRLYLLMKAYNCKFVDSPFDDIKIKKLRFKFFMKSIDGIIEVFKTFRHMLSKQHMVH